MVTRFKGRQMDTNGIQKDLQMETLRDTFCVRDASFEGRRSASNQYFLMGFFKSALDFQEKTMEPGRTPEDATPATQMQK